MRCILNGEEIDVPESLIENEALFKSVVNIETWNTLSYEERNNLLKYIPGIPTNEDGEDEEEEFKLEAVRLALSSDENFKHGNPTQEVYRMLKDGMLSPSVQKIKKKCKKLKYKNYKLNQKEYYKNLLEEIIISRQLILDKTYQHGPGYKLAKRKSSLEFQFPASEKVKKKFDKIIRDVAAECGDDNPSSDEEGVSNSFSVNSSRYEIPTKFHIDVDASSRRFSVFQNDGVTTNDFHRMMYKHKQKRVLCEDHPELDTTNISLADVIGRCNSIKKPGKFKKNKLNKKKKLKKVDATDQKVERGDGTINNVDKSVPVEKRKKDLTKKSLGHGYPKMGSFFSLLGYFFEQEREKKCSIAKLEEKVVSWQSHKSSDLSGWKALYSSWIPLVKYAVEYMTGRGTASLLHEFIPLLLPDDGEHWTWTGPEHNNDDVILPLCHHWFETLSQAMNVDAVDDKDRQTIDTTRTTFVVRKSTDEEKDDFRKQEKERYEKPHCAYIYKTHGYESIVGPVKGVFSKDATSSKAREHAMLVSDRPAFVTILCLVRDAVARLPNGEGTRAEVCTLLKDSQFLNPQATDSQVHGVVSGALDRLHAEKDPCVKFDAIRKVWIYLHRVRSVEKFEKLHEASAAAALAKKQISHSKQKAAKQKRASADQGELPKECKQKKTATPKSKKSKNVETKDASQKETDSTPTVPTEGPKKKPAKRKRSANDTGATKLPKLTDFPLRETDELQLSLENLMATQSILSGDESDMFGSSNPPCDLFDAFNTSNDDVPNLSMDPSFEAYNISNIDQLTEGINQSKVSVTEGQSHEVQPNVDTLASRTMPQENTIKSISNRTSSLSVFPDNHPKSMATFKSAGQRRRSTPEEIQLSMPASLISKPSSSPVAALTARMPVTGQNTQSKIRTQQISSSNLQELLLQRQPLVQHQLPSQQTHAQQQQKNSRSKSQSQNIVLSKHSTLTSQSLQQQLRLQQLQNKSSPQQKVSQAVALSSLQRNNNLIARPTQPRTSAPIVQSQIGLSLGNLRGTSLQTLSQFITSKVIPVAATKAASDPESLAAVPSRNQPIRNPYQVQQMPQKKVAPKPIISPAEARMQFQFQHTTGNNVVKGLQLVDIKGSRGNQVITARPPVTVTGGNQVIAVCSPAAVTNIPKINVAHKTAFNRISPVQTFSLNQLMAVARNRAPGMESSKSNVTIPMSQIVRTSTPQAPRNVQKSVSIQNPVSTHLVIQRQVSSGGDQSVANIVRLSKQGEIRTASPHATSMPIQKIEVSGILPGQLRAQHQQANRPIVAPLKISLPRNNFTGVASPVRLISSPGQSPVRLTSANVRLISPTTKTSNVFQTTASQQKPPL